MIYKVNCFLLSVKTTIFADKNNSDLEFFNKKTCTLFYTYYSIDKYLFVWCPSVEKILFLFRNIILVVFSIYIICNHVA